MKAIRHKTNKGPSSIFQTEENLFFDLPKCFVVAIILPVGKSFDTEWLVSVAGGLWTVSTAGIITAGVPFKEWAMWVVLADRNLEKPGDIHLEENILEKKNQARIFVRRLWKLFQYGRRILRHYHPWCNARKTKPLTSGAHRAPFSKFCAKLSQKKL